MRRCRTESDPEPWIEQLVLNRGEGQRATSVRAHVVGVSDLTESQCTDASDACMLFLSDGTVFIPAVLSAAAWEHMQELEERDTFSGLDNTTVSVRKFQLNFHMDPELTSCQFYLTVNQIVTVGRVTRHHRPPSCTMLPSVRQQILMTWRSLMKESSVTSMSSQSGFPLSCLMGAWHNDIIMDLLNDAIQKIAAPSAGHLGTATPTNWHRERLRCRGEECFSTLVSHLLIPEEQREMLTADPGVSSSSETPSGPLPPCVAEPTTWPLVAQDRGGDSSAPASDRLEEGHQLTLNNTRAGLSEVWCGGGGGGGGGGGDSESPWDLFYPAADLLAASPSSTSASGLERLLQPDGRSRLTEESGIIGPPVQRPHPSQNSPAHQSDPTTLDLRQEPQRQSPLTSLTHTAAVHSDGSSFSYTYEPCPDVASALSRCEVPERLVQWAVAYLGTPRHTPVVRSGAERRKLAVLE
ncbi:adrenocortical dysplasia protein homolog isoform X2 [Hemibagrus wyckioides]|uniref:adrenocortical dysplasia protein homolog isoform X2 n=1 Tax=Hemibagrus wyckioides TaxID=337641 RepID=UPI00266CC7C6|nr:adrenocortical dysplasia protein homolog isoform X2 [Hemibagrus wyckioides]